MESKKENKISLSIYPDKELLAKIERHRFRSGGLVRDLNTFMIMRDLALKSVIQIFSKEDLRKIAEQTLPVCDSLPSAAFALVVLQEVKGLDQGQIDQIGKYEAAILLNEIAAWKSHNSDIEHLFRLLGLEEKREDASETSARVPTEQFIRFQKAIMEYAQDPQKFEGLVPHYSFEMDEFVLLPLDELPDYGH